MLRYFFCNICLEITGERFIYNRLATAQFTVEQPYEAKILLNITKEYTAAFKPVSPVSTESDIEIFTSENDGWIFSVLGSEDRSCILANSDYSSIECFIDGSKQSHEITEGNCLRLLRLAIECNFAYYKKISLHSSCIANNGSSVLFTAPSGTGKSTQAELWRENLGAEILSGDRPCLSAEGDCLIAYGVPWDGKEQIFLQKNYPAAAIIEVRQAKENSLRVLSGAQAFRLLLKQTFIPSWDDTAKFLILRTLKAISDALPFYRFFCLPDVSAAEFIKKAVLQCDNSLIKEFQNDMQIKDGFILKNVVGEWIVMPKGSNIKSFEGAIVLNEISAYIWKRLENPISRDDLLDAILSEYDVDKETASGDLDILLEKLSGLGILVRDAI